MTRRSTDPRTLHDGSALQVLHASRYLLCHGEPTHQKADTLRLLRHERAKRRTRGPVLDRLEARNN
jgi:hypothetical protein